MRSLTLSLVLAVAAGCGSNVPRPVAPPPTPVAHPVETVRTPTPAPTPVPTVPAPSAVVSATAGPPIRVLLSRTAGAVSLPQPDRVFRIGAGGDERWMWGPLTLTATADSAWQVGAWSDPATAVEVVAVLDRGLGPAVVVWHETTTGGLVRVRVRWTGTEPPDAASRLAALGFDQAYRVAEPGSVRVVDATGGAVVGREVVLAPAAEWPTAVGGRSYRGRFRARAAGGDLLLINELGLEDYLRGVVPVEMGPFQFPELAALEAQAIAARTYAVAHLGDHDDEGWDICATPACQAYSGVDAEHPLTDRAIADTAALIATFDGAPIDAMYTSTCGGHTEDAAELFPGRGHPYLKGVVCAWERPIPLAGEAADGEIGDQSAFRRLLARRALGLPAGDPAPRDVLPAVARLCGGVVEPTPPVPDLTAWVEALLAAGGLDGTSPLTGGEGAGRLVDLADLFDVPLPPPPADRWRSGWHLEAAAAVLELQGVIRRDVGDLVPHPDGAAIFPRRAERSEPLAQPLPLVWRWDGVFGATSALRALPGTTVERYRLGEAVLALVVVRSDGDGEADRRSAWRSWSRDRSWADLQSGLRTSDLAGLEVTRRSRSGRVVTLSVIDGGGHRRRIEGFDIRQALDLPETLFQMHVMTGDDGGRFVRFLGRGWGHGIGLCQNGAYGLARAGMDYDEILKHYYTGIEIVAWNPE